MHTLSGSVLSTVIHSKIFIKPAAVLQEVYQWPIGILNKLRNLEILEWQLS
jgi:hypothetical protein